jgi:hypothetical protein
MPARSFFAGMAQRLRHPVQTAKNAFANLSRLAAH